MPDFRHIQVGDEVTRLLAETVPMPLKVTKVEETLIHCGPWMFDRATGVEEDPELGWGIKFGVTGSRLIR